PQDEEQHRRRAFRGVTLVDLRRAGGETAAPGREGHQGEAGEPARGVRSDGVPELQGRTQGRSTQTYTAGSAGARLVRTARSAASPEPVPSWPIALCSAVSSAPESPIVVSLDRNRRRLRSSARRTLAPPVPRRPPNGAPGVGPHLTRPPTPANRPESRRRAGDRSRCAVRRCRLGGRA